jgi:hypothetical protein
MSDAALADERPVARKHHRCDQCQCSIAPGQKYRRARFTQDGTAYTWKAHLDCDALAARLWKEYALSWDEGVILHDEERDELVEWRGDFPHVICRVELGWELARQHNERRRAPEDSA